MINNNLMNQLNNKGILTNLRVYDSANATLPNNVIGAGILTALSQKVLNSILAKRSADELIGTRNKLLDFGDHEYAVPFIETLGATTPYGDYINPLSSDINLSFNRIGHYRFTTLYKIGTLEAEQLGKSRVEAQEMKLNAALNALSIEFNRVAFHGYVHNNAYLVYGLLNDPKLSAAEAAPKKFNTMSYQELVSFFANAISKLSKQSGNNINVNSKIKVGIPPQALAILNSITPDANNAFTALNALKNSYPNIEFISAVELESENGTSDMLVLIGESEAGGITDTAELGYSEFARAGNLVIGLHSTEQALDTGTVGAVIYKPDFIVRYTGI